MQFRIAVARHYDQTGSSIETAEVMGCSESWVRDLIKRQRETGSLDVLPRRGSTNPNSMATIWRNSPA